MADEQPFVRQVLTELLDRPFVPLLRPLLSCARGWEGFRKLERLRGPRIYGLSLGSCLGIPTPVPGSVDRHSQRAMGRYKHSFKAPHGES